MSAYIIKKHMQHPWKAKLFLTPPLPFIFSFNLSFPIGLPPQSHPFFSKWTGLDFSVLGLMNNEFTIATNNYLNTLTIGIYQHHATKPYKKGKRLFPIQPLTLPYQPNTALKILGNVIVSKHYLSLSLTTLIPDHTYHHHATEPNVTSPKPITRLYNAYYGGKYKTPSPIPFFKKTSISKYKDDPLQKPYFKILDP